MGCSPAAFSDERSGKLIGDATRFSSRQVRTATSAQLIEQWRTRHDLRMPVSDQSQRRRIDPLVLIRGLPGHPLHPPLTDATIGMYVLAGGLAIIGYSGAIKLGAAKGMWLALIGGLIVSVPTALSGLVDWLTIEWGSARVARGNSAPDGNGHGGGALCLGGLAAVRRLPARPCHNRGARADAMRRGCARLRGLAWWLAGVRARDASGRYEALGRRLD